MLTAWFCIHIIRVFLAPVAQLDRVSGYEPEGRAFESLRVRQRKFILSAPIILIDDIAAELDHNRQQKLLHFLAASDSQLYITHIDGGLELPPALADHQRLHIDAGVIRETN